MLPNDKNSTNKKNYSYKYKRCNKKIKNSYKP